MDLMFIHFLQLRLIVVEALGHMAHILSRDKLEELLPKVIPGILGLYKKHADAYYITQVSQYWWSICFHYREVSSYGAFVEIESLNQNVSLKIKGMFPQNATLLDAYMCIVTSLFNM